MTLIAKLQSFRARPVAIDSGMGHPINSLRGHLPLPIAAQRRSWAQILHRLAARAANGQGVALLCVAVLLGIAATLAAPREWPRPPQVLLGDLYAAVEQAGIFPDSKVFADATPRSSPASILSDFRKVHPVGREALEEFVKAHFILPSNINTTASLVAPSAQLPIVRHIDALWPQLVHSTRRVPRYSSLIALSYPYVVPGGRFREMYYWDSYFTMLGLAESGRQDLVRDMVSDFAHEINSFGHIPNGNRTYYLSRSQPPFFFEMVGLLDPKDPAEVYAQYLPELKTEYRFWMHGERGLRPGQARYRVVALSDGSVLNRYWDGSDTPRDESFREDVVLAKESSRLVSQIYRDIRAAAESGWDFSSRWLSNLESLASIDTTEIVPVDLNSLLFGLETAIRLGCDRIKDRHCTRDFAGRADRRRAAVNRFLWSASDSAYLDYRWTRRTSTDRFSAAMLYPLFVGLADAAQAATITATVHLVGPGMLTSYRKLLAFCAAALGPYV